MSQPQLCWGQSSPLLGLAWPQRRPGNILALAKSVVLMTLLCEALPTCYQVYVGSVSRGQQESCGQGF